MSKNTRPERDRWVSGSKNMSDAGRPILHAAMTSNIADLKRRFAEAKPFRHVLIENFFAKLKEFSEQEYQTMRNSVL